MNPEQITDTVDRIAARHDWLSKTLLISLNLLTRTLRKLERHDPEAAAAIQLTFNERVDFDTELLLRPL